MTLIKLGVADVLEFQKDMKKLGLPDGAAHKLFHCLSASLKTFMNLSF